MSDNLLPLLPTRTWVKIVDIGLKEAQKKIESIKNEKNYRY